MEIILDATTKSLEIKLAGAPATNQLPFVLSYVDRVSATQAVSAIGSTDGVTNGTTAVEVLAAPASGHTRQVLTLTVPNEDTAIASLILQYNNNGTRRKIGKFSLDPDDNFIVEA